MSREPAMLKNKKQVLLCINSPLSNCNTLQCGGIRIATNMSMSIATAAQQQKQQHSSRRSTAAAAAAAAATAADGSSSRQVQQQQQQGPGARSRTPSIHCQGEMCNIKIQIAVLQQGTSDMPVPAAFPHQQRTDRLGIRTTLAPVPRRILSMVHRQGLPHTVFIRVLATVQLRLGCCWS